MTEYSLKAYDVLDELIHDLTYQELKHLNKVIEETYKDEIEIFRDAKIKYTKVMEEGGTYHPDFKAVSKRLSEAKKGLYETKEMMKYVELEKSFQAMLNSFLNEVTHAISSHIKKPDAFGIIVKGGSCHVY